MDLSRVQFAAPSRTAERALAVCRWCTRCYSATARGPCPRSHRQWRRRPAPLDEWMHRTHGQGGQPGDSVTADSASEARPTPPKPPAGDDFPALGISPEGSEQRTVAEHDARLPAPEDTRSRSSAGGWAQVLRRPAAAADLSPDGQSGIAQPQFSAGGSGPDAVEGGGTALPAKARKAAAAEQLLAEARRSVVDAMTGDAGSPLPVLPLSTCLQRCPASCCSTAAGLSVPVMQQHTFNA